MEETSKICLITGASSGIGEYLAHEMVQRGWRVVAVARRGNKLDKLAETLGRDNIIPMVCDVGRIDQVKDVSAEMKSSNVYPTLFFLNAGDGNEEDDKGLDLELHRRTFDTNYFGVMTWVDQWIITLKERNGGTFVATSSIQSLRGMPGAAAYGASKSALNYSFESMDAMYYKDGIRFLVAYPGPIDTAMLKTEKPLPCTWGPQEAAKYIVKGALRGSTKIQFPLLWVLIMKIVRSLPSRLYLRVFRMK